MALQVKAISVVQGSTPLQVKALSLTQGSNALRVKAISLMLFGMTPNNTPPLVTPQGFGAIIGSSIIVKQDKKPA